MTDLTYADLQKKLHDAEVLLMGICLAVINNDFHDESFRNLFDWYESKTSSDEMKVYVKEGDAEDVSK